MAVVCAKVPDWDGSASAPRGSPLERLHSPLDLMLDDHGVDKLDQGVLVVGLGIGERPEALQEPGAVEGHVL